jgi:hypothetical protein
MIPSLFSNEYVNIGERRGERREERERRGEEGEERRAEERGKREERKENCEKPEPISIIIELNLPRVSTFE